MKCEFCDRESTGDCSACEVPLCGQHGELCPDCGCDDESFDEPLCDPQQPGIW